MTLSWSGRRKLLYVSTGSAVALFVALWLVWGVLSTPATCSDGKKNQEEAGTDCGGPCVRLCEGDARAPVVLWARALRISPHSYTAVAYIQNTNTGASAGARDVRYSFRLFDRDDLLIVERAGVIDIPPQQIVPLVEVNIETGDRAVARAFFSFDDTHSTIAWEKVAAPLVPQVRITQQSAASDNPFSALVENTGAISARSLAVVTTLFDADGTVVAAGKSVVARLDPDVSRQVIFTWATSTAEVVRAETIAVPVW